MNDVIFAFMIIVLGIVACWCIDKAYNLGYKQGKIDGFEIHKSNKGD